MTLLSIGALLILLQTATSVPVAGLVEDVRTLSAASTNEQRFDALTALLKRSGIAFSVEPFTIEKPLRGEPRTEGRNIVVTFGTGEDEVVIGAHYDAARLADGSLSRGAVDNAASSVILVQLAHVLKSESLPFRTRIVWFDMEELGLVGSSQYLQRHTSDRIVGMLNLDINAYGNTVLFGPSERKENADLRRRLVETCAALDLACVGFPQLPPGDDRSFTSRGIPTVSLAVLPAVEVHQLWLMMNAGAQAGLAQGTAPAIMRTIHTPADTADKVESEAMAQVLRFVLTLVRNVKTK